MKKLIKIMIDVIFVISLTLIGKYDINMFELSKYQIILTVFWISGLFKYRNPEISIKESIYDSFKDLIISIAIVPLYYWISNSVETDFFEPISVLFHYLSLVVILSIAKKEAKSIGITAYYTFGAIPIIAIIFSKLGTSATFSIFIAVAIIFIVNSFLYKKKISLERNNKMH